MPDPQAIELDAHEFTRVFNLALQMYEEDADLREVFVEAMHIYREFRDDLAAGGAAFQDDTHEYISSREVGPKGEIIRFTPQVLPPKLEKKKEKGEKKPEKDDKKKKEKK